MEKSQHTQEPSRLTRINGKGWGYRVINKLTTEHIRAFYRKKREDGATGHLVWNMHRVLRQALYKAVDWGLLTHNPAASLKKDSPKYKAPTPKVWTREQALLFLEHVKDSRWAAVFYLAIGTGMREGEILGLPLDALHIEDGFLEVKQSLAQCRGGSVRIIQDPKTKSSFRRINLPEFVKPSLRKHLERRALLTQSGLWVESGLVFTTRQGAGILASNLLTFFKRQIGFVGLSPIRFHELRHTCATILLQTNTHPKIVQELLGHADISVTLNTYSHVLKPMSNVAANTMDDQFGMTKV